MLKTPSAGSQTFPPHIAGILVAGLCTLGLSLALIFELPVLLPFLIAAGILFIFLTKASPFFLLVLLVVVRMSLDYSAQYFSFTLFDITLSLSQIMGLGIATLGLIVFIIYREKLKDFPLNFPFLLILVWGLLTLLYSISPADTLQELLRFFDLYALGFLSFVAIKNTADFRNLLSGIFIASLPALAFGLYQFVFGIGLIDENVGIPRIFGTFSHPNVFSLYLFSLVALGFLSLLAFAENGKKRLWVLALIGITTIVLLLTFARVAWISLFVFLFLLSVVRYRLLLVPLILTPLLLFIFSTSFQDRVSESFQPDPDSSILWRQILWDDVISQTVLDDRTFLGSGMDTAPLVSERLRGTALGPNETHNDFVKFFVEGGWVGLGVFLFYLTSLLYILIKNYRLCPKNSALRISFGILILFFLSIELASLTDNVFKNTPVQWLFFIVLGGLLALSKNKGLDKKKEA